MGAARAMVAVVLLFAVTSVAAQDAPAGAPSVGAGCLTALVDVSDCLTYAEEGSNLTAPAKACCPELAGLVESNLTCLCELLRRADSLMVHINVSRMMELPSACDISTPPASLCSAARVPGWDHTPSDVEPIAPGTSPSLTGPETNGNNGARRTGTALSALSIVAGALPAFFLAP